MKKLNKKAAILACFSLSLAMGTVGVASLSNETVSANSTLTMEKGASLYLDDVSGLKFSFTDSAYDENETYGMLIVPFDYLAKAGITDLETETDFIGKLNQAKEDGLIEKAPLVKEVLPDENEVFSHSVGNLYEYNYVREFFGIGYKEVSEGVYEYAQPAEGYKREDNVRSVFEVANLALNKLEYEEWGENAEDLAEKAKLDEYSGGEDGVANTKDDTLDNFIVKGLTFVYGTATPTLTAEATYVGGEVTPTVATAKQKDIDLAMHWDIDDSVLARGRHNVEATLGGVITQACPVDVLKDETELGLYKNSSQADFFAVDGKISVSGGFYDASSSNTETHGGTVGYVAFEDTYTLNEQGTYIDVYFTGNNMPIVEFFANGANEHFMSSDVAGKGFLIDNGLAASTANRTGSTSKYNGWSEYDGYFSYGVTAYNNRKRDANSYTVGSYMEYNGVGTGTRQATITMYSYGNGTESTKGYVDMSMYSLAQVQKADQNYRYTIGMYKDSDGYVWLDSTLYKIDENGKETVFSFWETKVIIEGSAHSVTRDKLNVDEVISGKIVLRGAVKGRTSANTGTEPTVFTCSAPYAGTNAKSAYEHEGATFNADGTVSLKGAWTQSATGNYDNVKNATLGYVALEGKYDLGTYVDFYFTGNNMPQVSFFNKYVTDNLSAAYGNTNDNTGIVIINGFYNMSNYGYRYYVYGPNRINSYFNAMSSAYMEGANSSNQSPVSSEALSAFPEQRFKYTVGFYADANGDVYIDMDLDMLDENGVTADYYALNKKLTGVTTTDIQGDRIIAYGAVNGGTAITFSYSEPYTK